jgi:membrane protease YdiL (CAAX protease family)
MKLKLWLAGMGWGIATFSLWLSASIACNHLIPNFDFNHVDYLDLFWIFISIVIPAALLTGFLEEWLFRNWLYKFITIGLSHTFILIKNQPIKNNQTAIFITSLVFGLCHYLKPNMTWWALSGLILWAIFLNLQSVRYQSIAWGVGFHQAWIGYFLIGDKCHIWLYPDAQGLWNGRGYPLAGIDAIVLIGLLLVIYRGCPALLDIGLLANREEKRR